LGESLLSFPVTSETVLYLCLEDSFTRIQTRLLDITDEAPENLHFATMSEVIGEGLEKQIEDFLNTHTDTVLIVIDTLQGIRRVSADANPYACDYRDISKSQRVDIHYKFIGYVKMKEMFGLLMVMAMANDIEVDDVLIAKARWIVKEFAG